MALFGSNAIEIEARSILQILIDEVCCVLTVLTAYSLTRLNSACILSVRFTLCCAIESAVSRAHRLLSSGFNHSLVAGRLHALRYDDRHHQRGQHPYDTRRDETCALRMGS